MLALQGAFIEHITLLRQAIHDLRLQHSGLSSRLPTSTSASPNVPSYARHLSGDRSDDQASAENLLNDDTAFEFLEVRTRSELELCSALILPGGESTAISLIAERTGLLEPLRDFVKVRRKPVWGTCAGLILLAEEANRSKDTGQALIGGLDVRVQRNYFGRQVESFEAKLDLNFLGEGEKFHSVFIRAPVVERVLSASEVETAAGLKDAATGTVTAPARSETSAEVEILGRLPGRARALKDKTLTAEELGEDGDIVAVKQGNVFGTAFHPELTGDGRIHAWWLQQVMKSVAAGQQYPVPD